MEWAFWGTAVVCAATLLFLLKVGRTIWWKPLTLKMRFEGQGMSGPPYKLVYGNSREISRMVDEQNEKGMQLSHDIIPRVLPHLHHWTQTYGKDFMFWFGTNARWVVSHPEVIKEIMSTKHAKYPKLPSDPVSRQLLGDGLAELTGEKWSKHRRIISPAFHMDLLKGMIPTIVQSSAKILGEWRKSIMSGASEIDVQKEFRDLTADVISRTAFGSSFAEGRHIFEIQTKQILLAFESFNSVYIPGFRFLPTAKNRQRWNLEKEIRRSIRQIIDGREKNGILEEKGRHGTDLLGVMMSESKEGKRGRVSIDEIIDECKTFYFAGHETTSVLLTWSVMLLGMHQDWQERGRREVLEVCGKNNYPDADTLSRLKIVGMIINEALRLYPPAATILRRAGEEMKVRSLSIPAGTELLIPIIAVHHDNALWGNDAKDFNPGRFSEGIAKAAKHPMAFIPFGAGPRICVGQNLAVLEAKIIVAMILQQFHFVTSPSYTHAPLVIGTLQPQHGAQLIFSID